MEIRKFTIFNITIDIHQFLTGIQETSLNNLRTSIRDFNRVDTRRNLHSLNLLSLISVEAKIVLASNFCCDAWLKIPLYIRIRNCPVANGAMKYGYCLVPHVLNRITGLRRVGVFDSKCNVTATGKKASPVFYFPQFHCGWGANL